MPVTNAGAARQAAAATNTSNGWMSNENQFTGMRTCTMAFARCVSLIHRQYPRISGSSGPLWGRAAREAAAATASPMWPPPALLLGPVLPPCGPPVLPVLPGPHHSPVMSDASRARQLTNHLRATGQVMHGCVSLRQCSSELGPSNSRHCMANYTSPVASCCAARAAKPRSNITAPNSATRHHHQLPFGSALCAEQSFYVQAQH